MTRKDADVRFFDKVDKTATCWNWIGYKNTKGYGSFRASAAKNPRPAHRFSYEFHTGPIPEGMQVDHICHNKSCVNPKHLRLATNKQNKENANGACSNSKSGIRGVSWHKETSKWVVRVGHNGRVLYGGLFGGIAEAEATAISMRNGLFTHNDADKNAA